MCSNLEVPRQKRSNDLQRETMLKRGLLLFVNILPAMPVVSLALAL